MAHVEKYTRAVTGHMLGHYDRSKEPSENIDTSRSHLNYNLAPQPLSQLTFLHKRLSEVKLQNRKDVNVMCDWILTAPKDLPTEEHEKFFGSAFNFMAARYGKENVISAYVHMDEAQPHMHFSFVPVVKCLKNGKQIEKVSAKEVINRHELRVFHDDLQKHIESDLGHEVSILNEATKEGNKSIADLKRRSATERLQEATAEATRILSEAQDGVKVLQQQEKTLQTQIESLQRDIMTSQQIKDVPHSKALMSDKLLVAPADFEALCKTAALAEGLLKEIKPARKINARAKEILQDAEKQGIEIVKEAQEKANSLLGLKESTKYRKKLEHIENVINSSPQLRNDYQRAEKDLQTRQRTHHMGHGSER